MLHSSFLRRRDCFRAFSARLETEECGPRGLELLATEAPDLCDLEAGEGSGWHARIHPLIPPAPGLTATSLRGGVSVLADKLA